MSPELLARSLDLFADEAYNVTLDEGAVLLGGFARAVDGALFDAAEDVIAAAPLRHMVTPGGWSMSVAMTNCGDVGWVSDRAGYRYDPADPTMGQRWPAMPPVFADLAARAARAAGFPDFRPDACLVNRYAPGTRLSLHQDKNERDLASPIVSVSLGLPAVFLWGGQRRSDRPRRIPLFHGDVVVWGGPARLTFHGILPRRRHPSTDRTGPLQPDFQARDLSKEGERQQSARGAITPVGSPGRAPPTPCPVPTCRPGRAAKRGAPPSD